MTFVFVCDPFLLATSYACLIYMHYKEQKQQNLDYLSNDPSFLFFPVFWAIQVFLYISDTVLHDGWLRHGYEVWYKNKSCGHTPAMYLYQWSHMTVA